ncbi:hypothetical protein ACH5RR_019244 [Cinchona calisaya]|uniref:ENTH domain-containing protein n=1 Tax=Cinchona calisaya TaxID=153742 RepID=A0ABD2ZRX6_9GENT
MDTHFLHELKRQASFFFKDKIKIARLALLDVTPTQLLTEEATNGDFSVPDTSKMRLISHAAFEVDDYWRIVGILHKRFNWGSSVQKKAGRVLKLIEDGSFLKEERERERERKLTLGTKGFGSFCRRQTSTDESLKIASTEDALLGSDDERIPKEQEIHSSCRDLTTEKPA